jgi:hypothetical protein
MREPSGQSPDGQASGGEFGAKFFQAKWREGGGTAKDQHGRKRRMLWKRAGAVKERGGILSTGRLDLPKNPLTGAGFRTV